MDNANNEGRRNQIVGRFWTKEDHASQGGDVMAELPTQRARYQNLLMTRAIQPDGMMEQLLILAEEMATGPKTHQTDQRVQELMQGIETSQYAQDHQRVSHLRAELREILAFDKAAAILQDIKARLKEMESKLPAKNRQTMH